MNREIKFRAWDKESQRILSIARLNFISEEALLFDLNEKCNYWKELCNVELMQYTGIKDKNEIEIYEGDIVQCTCGDCDGYRYVVNYQNGAFCLNDTKFPIGSWIMNFKHLKDLEVIGNIYENKELLENG